MKTQNTSEKEQIIAFLLLCLRNWYYFVISGAICLSIAIVYLKVKTPVWNISAKVSMRNDESLAGGNISKSQSLMSAFGIGSKSVNIEDETIKLSSQGYLKKMVRNLELNKVYTQSSFFGLSKKPLYDQSPIVLSVEPGVSDTIAITELDLKVNRDKTTVKIKYANETIGKYEIVSFPATIETPLGKFTFSKTPYYDDLKWPFNLNILLTNYEFMAQIYQPVLNIDFEKKTSDIINLEMESENISLSKKILNEVIQVYNREWVDDKQEISQKAELFIKDRLDLVKSELSKADKEIQTFKSKYNLTDIETDVTYFFTISAELQTKLIEAETQSKMVDIILDYVDDEDKKYALIPFSITTLDPAIADVVGKYNLELLKRNELAKSSIHTSALTSLDEQITIQRKNLIQSLNNVKKGMQISVTDLRKKENELNTRIGNVPTIEREYVSLKREQEIQQAIYVFLLEKNEETAIKATSLVPKLKVINEPFVAIKAVSPRLFRTLLTALFFGGLLIPLSLIYGTPYIRMFRRKQE
jgi:uncharacterized protein involved in exopolysaccharide biosynthesis